MYLSVSSTVNLAADGIACIFKRATEKSFKREGTGARLGA
jgi:hypothetical protein